MKQCGYDGDCQAEVVARITCPSDGLDMVLCAEHLLVVVENFIQRMLSYVVVSDIVYTLQLAEVQDHETM